MKCNLRSVLRTFLALLCLAIVPARALAQNYSDIWWNPNESGWGLTLADHNSQLFGVWFTYREDGRPTWYVIPGGMFSNDRKQFRGDIYATTGPAYSSATFDPSRVSARVVGTATIDFAPQGLAAGTALFGYSVGGITQTKQIQRQPFGNAAPAWGSDVTDIWWNPNESGWGLTLAQHGNNVFGVWFTYDTDSQPLWVVMPGVTFSGANSFSGTLYTTTGPHFAITPFDPARVVVTQQGSASIAVSSAATNSNPNCSGANSVSFDPVFRGNTARRTACAQAFGDPPGSVLDTLTTADLIPPGIAYRSTPGTASSPGIRLLEADLPELLVYEPDSMKAEKAAQEALAAQIAALPGNPKAFAETHSSKDAALDGANWGQLGMLGAVQLDMWSGKSSPDTFKGSQSSNGATVGVEMGGGTAADGTISGTYGIDIKAEGSGGNLTVKVSVKAEGKICPSADGSLPFKLAINGGGQAVVGSRRAGFQEEMTVTGTAIVNDLAYIEKVDFDIRVQSSAQRPDTHNAFVDGNYKGSLVGQWTDNYSLAIPSLTVSVSRVGSTTTPKEGAEMLGAGRKHAINSLQGFLELLQLRWRKGGCVEIIASVPDTVATDSSTPVEARVRHKIEGTDLHVPIESSLAGAVSLQPPRIAAAPGTFTYVAPGDADKVATLTFTTTSRRGMAKSVSSVRTKGGPGYEVDWSGGGTRVWGTICNGLENSFSLNFDTGGQITGTLAFSPSSASGGSVSLTGQATGGAITYTGGGAYTISGQSIVMSIGQMTATVAITGHVINVPGPSGTLPLLDTNKCPS